VVKKETGFKFVEVRHFQLPASITSEESAEHGLISLANSRE
jgi:hypothetical protein